MRPMEEEERRRRLEHPLASVVVMRGVEVGWIRADVGLEVVMRGVQVGWSGCKQEVWRSVGQAINRRCEGLCSQQYRWCSGIVEEATSGAGNHIV